MLVIRSAISNVLMNCFALNLIFVVLNECLSISDGGQGGYENDYYFNTVGDRNHILITPMILRPYISYGIMVHVFDNFFNEINNKSFHFHASISVRGDEITSVGKTMFWNSPQIFHLPIPISLAPDNYSLHVKAVDGGGKKVLSGSLQLFYEANFVSVVFQTARPIYSCGQTVRFRILVLETSLLPFNEVMDVFVLDPDGIVMKRWLSIYTNNDEVASLKFQLPKLAKNGVWKIRTKIQNQIDEISIIVETYFQPYFEVIISSPAFISEIDDNITASIYGIFSTQKFARGNATVAWSARRFTENETFFEIQNDFIFIAEKPHQISLPLRTIREMFDNIVGVEIKIVAEMKEFLSGETMSGYSHTRIMANNVKIEFLSKSPIVFTPGMPLFGFVTVSLENNEKVPPEDLQNSITKVLVRSDSPFPDGRHDCEIVVKGCTNEYSDVYEMLLENEIRQRYINSGIVNYRFDIPKDTKTLLLKATYQVDDQIKETNIKTIRRFSLNEKFFNVWTSSTNLKINEYAMFHLKANFVFENVYSLVLSKGILLQIYDHKVSKSSSLITFSVPISSNMAPIFHLIVYCFSNGRQMHVDAVTVPVDGFSRFETTLVLNTGKDFRNERIEAIASGGEGAFIGIQATRSVVYHLQGGNEITRDRVATSFLSFEKNLKSIGKIDWITRDGSLATESVFFPSFNYVFDGIHAFDLNYLNVSSNWKISTYDRKCDLENENFVSCLTSGCIPKSELCDQKQDCEDGSDESNCLTPLNPNTEYYLNRTSRNYFIFDPTEGDWGFREIRKNDHVGIEFEFLYPPETADDWYFVVFNMHMIHGFSIIESPVIFSSAKPLMAHITGPHKCHRGEQLGLKLHLHNHDHNQMLVTVTLLASDNYKFVHVENEGIVNSYAARLSSGNHQRLVYMAAKSETEIRFPVAPSLEYGIIEVNFWISSQSGRKKLTHVVNVLGEGALINRHTSLTLDFQNRGLIYQYMDIVVEESPYVPYENWRRYIYDSKAANVCLSNNLIGPIDFENPVFLNNLIKRESKGAADFAFELNANIWILHYLRLTQQLETNFLNNILNECNILFAAVMRYYNSDVGYFSNWEPPLTYPSVWLSSWILRILKYASFSEWQFSFWVDPLIFQKTLHWLLTYQQIDGSFVETKEYANPFDGRFVTKNVSDYPVSLTAHVLITLQTVMEFVTGDLKIDAVISSRKARIYLERALPLLKDPFLISLTSYALSITNSPEKGYAFEMLQKHARTNEEGLIYWSKIQIPRNPIRFENQKVFHLPRLYGETDSYSVEATSWALLVYLANDGVTATTESIVQWLISMRMSNIGFISVVDTAVAYQALTEFAFRSRFLDLTNIHVTVEMMASNETEYNLHINNKAKSSDILKVPFVWGHVNIRGKGSGIAYVQMDVDYGIDYESLLDKPPIDQFDLRITEFYSTFRNKSEVVIQSCLRYTFPSRAKSGAVVLEIQIPTGYSVLETEAIKIIGSKSHPTLRDVRITEEKTTWFFDYLEHQHFCFNHSIKRWYPVANLTLYRQAILYEIAAREHFVQILINSTALYTLSICEVCGSFQCPYCPYYNGMVELVLKKELLLLLFLVAVFSPSFVYIVDVS